jgi:hypothetical protein
MLRCVGPSTDAVVAVATLAADGAVDPFDGWDFAGWVGYFVTLAGRRAIYCGRNGDSHTEWFPGAK